MKTRKEQKHGDNRTKRAGVQTSMCCNKIKRKKE